MKQSSTRGGRPPGPALTIGEALPTAVPAQRRKGERRPEPVLSEAYAHLSVDALREYRRALTDEEHRVSYFRRVVQARLDLVVSGTTSRGLDHERLAPLLTTERIGAGRRGLTTVARGDDGIPPTPVLEQLWQRQVDPGDEAARLAFEQDLREAEQELSAYRTALHERIGRATGELIARYREAPELCLTALPVEPSRSRA